MWLLPKRVICVDDKKHKGGHSEGDSDKEDSSFLQGSAANTFKTIAEGVNLMKGKKAEYVAFPAQAMVESKKKLRKDSIDKKTETQEKGDNHLADVNKRAQDSCDKVDKDPEASKEEKKKAHTARDDADKNLTQVAKGMAKSDPKEVTNAEILEATEVKSLLRKRMIYPRKWNIGST